MPIKPTDKALKTYYATREELEAAQARTEGNTRWAFGGLLAETAKSRQWTLIEEQTRKSAGGVSLRYDGELQSQSSGLPYGYWEAKDTQDDLDREIAEKLKRGYASTNIIFEDTRRAVLIQEGQRVLEADLDDPQQLAELLNRFYAYEEPDYAGYEQASLEFKDRVPALARQLVDHLADSHEHNPAFIAAYQKFFELCQISLNSNISRAAVDEMLIQHLLTERLMRNVFDSSDFTRRNTIAAEVEKVIDALTSQSFSREVFFKDVERFYLSIEHAAKRLTDFSQKQTFINTVYERFFQGYSVKTADTHGIVYTPQPIVDFMCAAVEEVLASEFGLKLHDEEVVILDPCTGTGNFIVNLMNRIPRRHLGGVYKNQLFANELMLLPYYVASLNIERCYYELTGEYLPFEGLVFADTLDVQLKQQIDMFGPRNTQRLQRERESAITVIIGNPPYNVGQLSENDNNKNRRYDDPGGVDERIKSTYAQDSRATNKNAVYDAYVKFFRWASDRLNGRDGLVCFVSNNGFVQGTAFDGFRQHLLQDFSRVYHLDLGGNSRKSQGGQAVGNVFNIRVGVGITLAIRSQGAAQGQLFFYGLSDQDTRAQKLDFLQQHRLNSVPWQHLQPQAKGDWFLPENRETFASYLPLGTKQAKQARTEEVEAIFKLYSGGVKTNRDELTYDFSAAKLLKRMPVFTEAYNAEVDRYRRAGRPENIDAFVKTDEVKWSEGLKAALKRGTYAHFDPQSLRRVLYRPFSFRHLYYDPLLTERRYLFPSIFPSTTSEAENRVIALTGSSPERPFMTLMSQGLADIHLTGPGTGSQCFPFYVYEPDPTPNPSPNTGRGFVRRENITDWALARFRAHYSPSLYSERGLGGEVDSSTGGPGGESGGGSQDLTPNPSPSTERGFEDEESHSIPRELYLKLQYFAREMRKNPTWSENQLWQKLRNRQVLGFKFRRQHPIDQFIVDFYCSSAHLVIEVDGPIHEQQTEYDELRTACLEAMGLRVLRFTNDQVTTELNGVLEVIAEALSSSPSLYSERGPGGEVDSTMRGPGGEVDSTMRGPGGEVDSSTGGPGGESGGGSQDLTLNPSPSTERDLNTALPATPSTERGFEITKWDIFYYIYALLHHPTYRARFADNLKRELPRIPMIGGPAEFAALVSAGRALADLHLNYEAGPEFELTWTAKEGAQLDWRVQKMRLTPDKTGVIYNETFTAGGIPPEVFGYKLGNRSALEWVLDQYQVTEDKASGIISDPNNPDDPEYIRRLIGQVIHVSLKTLEITAALPNF